MAFHKSPHFSFLPFDISNTNVSIHNWHSISATPWNKWLVGWLWPKHSIIYRQWFFNTRMINDSHLRLWSSEKWRGVSTNLHEHSDGVFGWTRFLHNNWCRSTISVMRQWHGIHLLKSNWKHCLGHRHLSIPAGTCIDTCVRILVCRLSIHPFDHIVWVHWKHFHRNGK